MVFYKMGRAELLEGLPENVDVSATWLLVATHDPARAKQFTEKWGMKPTSRFRHVPDSFAPLLAKIGYCNLLCTLDPVDFRPICLPYILRSSLRGGGAAELAPLTRRVYPYRILRPAPQYPCCGRHRR
jgi:hypothetical protein